MRYIGLIALVVLAQANIQDVESGYRYLNELRSKAGMIFLGQNQFLQKAAKNHDLYLLSNNTTGHYEAQGLPHFTGVMPSDRAVAAGYPSRYIVENIAAGREKIEDAIDGLFSAIYHRFGFLNFTIDEVGAAFDTDANYYYGSVSTFDMGNKEIAKLCEGPEFSGYGSYILNICADPNKKISATKFQEALETPAKQNPPIVLWPYENATDIPPVFYEEDPDPLPECSVSGYPISVNFNPYRTDTTPQLIEFSLENERGEAVPLLRTMTHQNDSNGYFSLYDFAIFPQKRLAWDTTYHAKFVYNIAGETHTIKWQFHTRALPGPYYTVQDGESYRVLSGKRYFFYIPPQDCNDKIDGFSLRYYGNVEYENGFYDQDTLWIELKGSIGSEVDIRLYNGISFKVIIDSFDTIHSSSSSSLSSYGCPDGYEYSHDPEIGCIPISSSSSSSLSISSTSYSSSSDISSSSAQSSFSSNPAVCEENTIFVDGKCVDKVAYELAGKAVLINGYFAYFGESDHYDPYAWVYLSKSGQTFAKLEGMDPQTGLLRWKRLRNFFDNVSYQDGYIVVGSPVGSNDELVIKLANKRLKVKGYFAYYGDLQNYDPFAWVYSNTSGSLVAKLEGMDPSTGLLKWHFLISPRAHKLQWVRIQNDRLIFGPLAQ